MYGKHYTVAWPHEEHSSGRPIRRSPLYEVLKQAGASFGEKLGWERANWFAPAGVEPVDGYSFARPNWFEQVGEEHRAIRERVGVIDQSSFAKFMLVGTDAEAALGWLCANNVARAPGALIYTQLLNRRGGVECDVTVARLSADRYYITTGTGFATHDFHWIKSNIPPGMNAQLVDVTSSHAVLSLMGPQSRSLLAELTEDDIGNRAFPFATAERIRVAGAPVLALRITYVGELGWELHVPVEFARVAYQAIMEAGQKFDIGNAGYRAIESLRLEKGYRAWGAELTPDHTPLEAGLGWAVKLEGNLDFLGRASLARQQTRPLGKRLAGFTIDDDSVCLLGRETIFRDGERVGWLTSGGFGYTVGKGIGYGYVRDPDGVTKEYLESGSYELEIATERIECRLHLKPLYDPTMGRVKA